MESLLVKSEDYKSYFSDHHFDFDPNLLSQAIFKSYDVSDTLHTLFGKKTVALDDFLENVDNVGNHKGKINI